MPNPSNKKLKASTKFFYFHGIERIIFTERPKSFGIAPAILTEFGLHCQKSSIQFDALNMRLRANTSGMPSSRCVFAFTC